MNKKDTRQDDLHCCNVTGEQPLDQHYWNEQYLSGITGWDLREISPPIKSFIDSLEDKELRILIPGCGNSYEAEYLLQKGFKNVTLIDIAPVLVDKLQQKFKDLPGITIVLGDFFEHQSKYDLILEQTFFCALPPALRQKYVWKMYQLLNEDGVLAGLLFNRDFEKGPPFGGNQKEYEDLFKGAFVFHKMEVCTNSASPRANTELRMELRKNNTVIVRLFKLEGITCSGCVKTVSGRLMDLPDVLNASISTNGTEILVVSNTEIPLSLLQEQLAFNKTYKIS